MKAKYAEPPAPRKLPLPRARRRSFSYTTYLFGGLRGCMASTLEITIDEISHVFSISYLEKQNIYLCFLQFF